MRNTLERLKERKGDEGFTLIELLIVIIILAILATIVIFAVGTTTKNAAIASCKSTVKTVETALEAYNAQKGAYPAAGTWAKLTTATTTTTTGPWLRTKPHATVAASHYALTLAAGGKITLTTTNGKPTTKQTAVTADATPTPCTKA